MEANYYIRMLSRRDDTDDENEDECDGSCHISLERLMVFTNVQQACGDIDNLR